MLLIIPRIAEHAAPHVHLHPLVIFAICLASWAVIVPLSRLSYEYCELPSIALGKRWQKRRTARHAADSVVVDGVPPSSVVTQAAPVPPVAEL
jgi:peptidoglycan/LPS O-acetylase OafA/YrhL